MSCHGNHVIKHIDFIFEDNLYMYYFCIQEVPLNNLVPIRTFSSMGRGGGGQGRSNYPRGNHLQRFPSVFKLSLICK